MFPINSIIFKYLYSTSSRTNSAISGALDSKGDDLEKCEEKKLGKAQNKFKRSLGLLERGITSDRTFMLLRQGERKVKASQNCEKRQSLCGNNRLDKGEECDGLASGNGCNKSNCKCLAGFFPLGGGSCSACQAACKTCTSLTKCTSCINPSAKLPECAPKKQQGFF